MVLIAFHPTGGHLRRRSGTQGVDFGSRAGIRGTRLQQIGQLHARACSVKRVLEIAQLGHGAAPVIFRTFEIADSYGTLCQ